MRHIWAARRRGSTEPNPRGARQPRASIEAMREHDEATFAAGYKLGGLHVAAALDPALRLLDELLNGEGDRNSRERVRHAMVIARNAHNSAGEVARWWTAVGPPDG
jgi:hypothetical protein